MPLLERDVVVGRSREVGALLLRRARGHELVAAVAVAAATEELDALGDDLHRLPLARAVGRFPLAPVEPAVDADRAALREVLRATLGLVAEDRDVEVVGLVDPRARLVAPAAVHRYAHAANRRTAGGVSQLRVLRQVAHENDAVDVRHVLLLLPWIFRPGVTGFVGGASSLGGLLVRRSLLFRSSVLGLGALRNGRCGRGCLGRYRNRRRVVARRARPRAGDVARRHVAQYGVLDLEHAGDLGERLRLRVEDDE